MAVERGVRRCTRCGLVLARSGAANCWGCGLEVPPTRIEQAGHVVEHVLAALCAVALMLALLLSVVPAQALVAPERAACSPRARSVMLSGIPHFTRSAQGEQNCGPKAPESHQSSVAPQ